MAPTPTPTPSPAPSGDDFPVVVTGKVGGVRRSIPVWSGQKAVVLYLLLAQSIAQASWQADLESAGGDAVGMILTFWAFTAFVATRKDFQMSKTRGWKTLAGFAALGLAAYLSKWVMVALGLLMFAGLVHLAWDSVRSK